MLSPLQEQVGRIVAALPEADGFALAGGAALVVTRVVDRTTRDLDFFGPSAEDVDRDEFGMSISAYDELARAVEQWRQRLSVSHPTEPPGPALGL